VTLALAHRYRARGLSLIPVKTDGSKAPAVSKWKQFQKDAADESQVTKWFGTCAVRGMAIVCGEISGNLLVLDFEDVELFDEWLELATPLFAEAGIDIAKVPIVETPRPGRHVYLRTAEPPPANDKLAGRPATAEETATDPKAKIKTVIETRGEGGYVLSPGSPGACHATGREYRFLNEGWVAGGDAPRVGLDLLESLLNLCRALDKSPTQEVLEEAAGPKRLATDKARPGDEFNRQADWKEILRDAGATLVMEANGVQHWRRPGKAQGSISATVGVRRNSSDVPLLIVFSTSWAPFEATAPPSRPKAYTPFAAYALLSHGGNFGDAAKALTEKGFGRRQPDSGRDRQHDQADKDGSTKNDDKTPLKPPIRRYSASALIAEYPHLRSPVVEGMFRQGETCNIISLSKYGKSWLTYGLALSILTGRPWLGRFPTARGRVLIVDNELHRATIAGRIRTVADSMKIPESDYGKALEIWPLRGNLRNIHEIGVDLQSLIPGEFKLIIFDAKYRMMPMGVSENDNAAETQFYNLLDLYADRTGAAIAVVHHTSKGGQADKRVTDVGAGAGAQSRAADCHLILREHEDESAAVLDAAVRSFAPNEPFALRWSFPLWIADETMDASRLKGRVNYPRQKQQARDKEAADKILTFLKEGSATASIIRTRTGMSGDRFNRVIAPLLADKKVVERKTTVSGNECAEYRMPDA
jgi:hypothetical protein